MGNKELIMGNKELDAGARENVRRYLGQDEYLSH
jgi:hypothetical protein